MYILDLLNKIKWDKNESPADYTFAYEDRVLRQLVEKKYSEIKRIEPAFVVLEMAGEEVEIPLSRIKVVKKQGALIWRR
ncbi:MAG TPA: DUF504 domain-containing protein [Candidatus Binatia bacterium]|nr:DUF504 domain-containing protein [Candidatus Binatia bacterium]